MPRISQRPVAKLLKERFSIEDIVNLTDEDINLLAEIDAEVTQEMSFEMQKTNDEQLFEKRLLDRLVAQTS